MKSKNTIIQDFDRLANLAGPEVATSDFFSELQRKVEVMILPVWEDDILELASIHGYFTKRGVAAILAKPAELPPELKGLLSQASSVEAAHEKNHDFTEVIK